jgi:three-Cys-motif partner protein
VHIHTGDSSEYLTKEVLPKIQFKNYERALCLIDPYGLHIDWEVMYQAGQSKAIDMFLNFPVMDMNRNAIWKNPGRVPQDGIERMTKFWGDESWKQAAYAKSPQGSFFEPEMVKQGNDDIVAAFRQRLKKVAGFKFVPAPLPMRNSTNAVVYYLFFASQKPVAEKIISDIFRKLNISSEQRSIHKPVYKLANGATHSHKRGDPSDLVLRSKRHELLTGWSDPSVVFLALGKVRIY